MESSTDSQAMSEDSTAASTGQVRIRSNVCTDADAVHLVPWSLARTYWPERMPTARQKEEQAYLQRCDLCRRQLYEMHEFGCDHHVCAASGIPSVDEAARRRAARADEPAS